MKISMLLAWGAVLCVLLAAGRYLARVSKNGQANRIFHRLHLPLGLLGLLLGLLHGLLAGNFPGGKVLWGTMLLTVNWGSACFLLMVLLAASYLLRRQLKQAFMPVHRVLTVLLLAALLLHVIDVGVHVLDRAPVSSVTESLAVTSVVTVQPERSAEDSVLEAEVSHAETSIIEPEEKSSVETPIPIAETMPQVTFSGAVLADGVYQGSAQGYKSTITVEVTVEQGRVTDITVLEQNDTPNFYAYAETIPDTVVAEQSLQVDAVTGATYSSAGLLNAIEDALSGAVLEGELQVNTAIDALPEKGGHGKH